METGDGVTNFFGEVLKMYLSDNVELKCTASHLTQSKVKEVSSKIYMR